MTGEVSTSLEDWENVPNETEVSWRKACSCQHATATTGRILLAYEPNDAKGTITVRATMHPGPVCDACDVPWERVA